ncbi:MAG: cysteine methyltransferase [Anaerolinea sp.]|nr:cysteine methyltransferase [Anaerolinea sp.]
MKSEPASSLIYARIQDVVRQIPLGRVCNYGRVAELTGGCTARMVGYAMASLPADSDVPWQRVINAKGRISPHGYGYGSLQQRLLLEGEGVEFTPDGEIDLERFGWP